MYDFTFHVFPKVVRPFPIKLYTTKCEYITNIYRTEKSLETATIILGAKNTCTHLQKGGFIWLIYQKVVTFNEGVQFLAITKSSPYIHLLHLHYDCWGSKYLGFAKRKLN